MSVVALSVWAVPARSSLFKVTQPDGTELVVRSFGDEFYHGLKTLDGTVVEYDSETGWYRAVEATTLETNVKIATEKRQQINQIRAERMAVRRAASAAHEIGERCPREGNKYGLVILVNFKNATMVTPHKTFNDMFNKHGYTGNGHIGSVRDFFSDQSYGKLNIDFDVVGPVTVKNDYSYYGKNRNGTQGQDSRPEEMIVEACKLVNDSVDFSKYDWDGDGEVDQVYVIYAGYGENYGADANTIWPHEYQLSYASYSGSLYGPQKMDGVTIDTYACSAELAYTQGKTPNGIGTACHEFSHCLGFPDLYDTDYSGCPSMDAWDLMDAGSYNGPNGLGEVPAGMTAYERWMGGWLELNVLSDPCVVKDMPCLGDSACAYIIYNEKEHYEAYLLENRQNKRWYTYPSKAHGMLITHVDYNQQAWWYNQVNSDASHPRFTYVPANNSNSKTDAGYCGHLWPGTQGKTALTNTSLPAAKTFNANTDGKKFLNAPIEGITETNGKISFVFKGGSMLDAPVPTIEADDYRILLTWNSIEGATSYETKVSSMLHGEGGLLLSEQMSGLMSEKDGTKDVSDALDSYTALSGWTGRKLFVGTDGVKIGTSTAQGALRTPLLEAKKGIIIEAVLTTYGSDDSSVTIEIQNEDKQSVYSKIVAANGLNQVIELPEVSGKFYVMFKPKKRGYVRDIMVTAVGDKEESIYRIGNRETSFVMYDQEFDDQHDYYFQVRALNEGMASEWSKVVCRIVEDQTAIESVISEKKDCNTRQYDLFGRFVKNGNNKFQIINNQLIYQKK